jgi:hypothetical protein
LKDTSRTSYVKFRLRSNRRLGKVFGLFWNESEYSGCLLRRFVLFKDTARGCQIQSYIAVKEVGWEAVVR